MNVKRRNEAHTGTITNIYADTAQYVVSIPALGHVETGLGTREWVIPFEELHPLAAAPEDFQLQAQAG